MTVTLFARTSSLALVVFACLPVPTVLAATSAFEMLGSYDGPNPESGLVIDPQNERILYGATANPSGVRHNL